MFYSHCGNRTVSRDKSIDRRTASWIVFSLWTKHDDNTLISRLLRMHKFKEQICSSWFAPVGSASDYPLLSKWAIYGEVSILCLLFVFRWLYPFFLVSLFLSLSGSAVFKWIRFLQWNFTSLLFVGYIHGSLHCQLCRRAFNGVCQLSKHFSLPHFYRNFLLMNLYWRNLGNADSINSAYHPSVTWWMF